MSFKVIGIGEVLWDLLAEGRQLGGAPANFAYHAQALGARAGVVTRVGCDDLGQDIQRKLVELHLPLELVQTDASKPTGTVTVDLAGEGIPEFTIERNAAWDHIEPTEAALHAARQADAICFGTLAQRENPSRNTIRELLKQSNRDSLRVFDVNLRQNFYTREVIESSLELANALKLNDAELEVLSAMFDLKGDVVNQVGSLAERFELRLVALTRGGSGSLLHQAGRWSECQSRAVQVKDTVGAGDAFTAAMVMGLLRNMDLDRINTAANELARYVCSCAGATPTLPEDLRRLFSDLKPNCDPILKHPLEQEHQSATRLVGLKAPTNSSPL